MEPDNDETGWEWEWKQWMDSMEEHIEFRGEEIMAESLSKLYEGDTNGH